MLLLFIALFIVFVLLIIIYKVRNNNTQISTITPSIENTTKNSMLEVKNKRQIFEQNTFGKNRDDVIRHNQTIIESNVDNKSINYNSISRSLQKSTDIDDKNLKNILDTQIIAKLAEKQTHNILLLAQENDFKSENIFSSIGVSNEKELAHEIDLYLLGTFGLIEFNTKNWKTVNGVYLKENLFATIYENYSINKRYGVKYGKALQKHFERIPAWINKETGITLPKNSYKIFTIFTGRDSMNLNTDKLSKKHQQNTFLYLEKDLDEAFQKIKELPEVLTQEQIQKITNLMHKHKDYKEENSVFENMLIINEKEFSNSKYPMLINEFTGE